MTVLISTRSAPEPAINSTEWACRSKHERLYPEADWSFHPISNKATNIAHPFLNKFAEINGHVCVMMGEWVIIGYSSLAMVHIYKDFVNIECIATPQEFRREGSATKLMEAFIAVSDETGIPLRLRACNVTGHDWNGIAQHPVIAKAMQKKNKLPVRELPKWYQKFGFVIVAQVFRKGKANGWNMLYSPKIKDNATAPTNSQQ